MNQRALRWNLLPMCCGLLIAFVAPHILGAQKPRVVAGPEVDQSVIAVLSHQGTTKPKVISTIDLTELFGTLTQWTFVAAQDDGHPTADFDDHGPIFLCLVKAISPNCVQDIYQENKVKMPWSDMPYHLFAGSVVYGNPNKSTPLLLIKVCGVAGADGDCWLATALYRYDKGADRFVRVFLNFTGRNNNQATRFVESGPLQGDVIVDNPTENAPYAYWIEVYRAEHSGRYGRILRYRSHTRYSDGNPLAVADSEMPEILHRLGLWQPGDPLPVPTHLPKGCSQLFMRDGEEWCK